MSITPAFGGDIQFTSIDVNAFSANDKAVLTGGTVQILASGMVQGIGTIPNTDGLTINARSLTGSAGTVSITHDGGPNNVPFTLGSATTNGLAGGIATSSTPIASGSYPVLPSTATVSAGTNVTITSINTPPTLIGNKPLIPSFEPGVPIALTYDDLVLQVADENGDTVFVIIDQIQGGILRVNGDIVGPGTTINPGDELEFFPFADTAEAETGFTIRASDTVSVSEPFAITTVPGMGDIELYEEEEAEEDSEFIDPAAIVGGDIEAFDEVAEVDGDFSEEFEDYYDLPATPAVDVGATQDILAEIERKTGTKPALIYARFTPGAPLATADKQGKPSVRSQPDGDLIWDFNSRGIPSEIAPRRPGPAKLDRKELESDQLELMIVTSQGEPVRKRVPGVSRGTLFKLAQQFRQSVTDPTSDDYLTPAQELYNLMIAPLEAQMQTRGITNLTFLTDAGLRSLPLAALHDGKQFLIEKYSLGLMPSLSLTDTRYVNIQQARVLAMGASKFQDQTPLPAVPEELSTIAEEIWRGRSFLNQGFTVKNLQAQRQQDNYGILHLATHGEFRPGAPSNSYIQFWDSKLQLDQIRKLQLNNPPIELLVLSACRTALGDRQAELGFAGLAVQAGVKSALGSLWYVSDEGTLALMTEFYQNLKATPVKAEALRRSQLAMIQGQVKVMNGKLQGPRGTTPLPTELANLPSRSLAHPYYWAAFTLIGNPW